MAQAPQAGGLVQLTNKLVGQTRSMVSALMQLNIELEMRSYSSM
jgi:hypothetical protein